MQAVRRRNRLHAIRGALRMAERLLVADKSICVRVYQASGLVSLFQANGRGRKVLARFSWDVTTEGD